MVSSRLSSWADFCTLPGTMSKCAGVLLFALVSIACNKERVPEPAGSPASEPASPPSTQAQPHSTASQPVSHPTPSGDKLGVTWTVPETWKQMPSSPMRKATYQIPPVPGDTQPAEMAVFYFGSDQGGGVDANIDRWVGQFQEVPDGSLARSRRDANGLEQHVVEVKTGNYSGGMMTGNPEVQKDYGMLGGVVVAPTGKYFFKLTGPSKTVQAQREAFDALLAGMKAAD